MAFQYQPVWRWRPTRGRRGRVGRERDGFTLVELLAAAAVVVVVAAAGAGVLRLAASVSGLDAKARAEGDATLQVAWWLRTLPYVSDDAREPSVVGALFPHASPGGGGPDAPVGGNGAGDGGFFVAQGWGPWPPSCFVAYHATDAGTVCTVAQFVRPAGTSPGHGWSVASAPVVGAEVSADADEGWAIVPADELRGLALLEEPPAALRVELRSASLPVRPALATLFFVADGSVREAATTGTARSTGTPVTGTTALRGAKPAVDGEP
jgi:prepilin-type N-terminal cleavage/methylation domain-containing protein